MELLNVRERIRTLGLLVRSQTLYPAELHAHNPQKSFSDDCDLYILHHQLIYVNNFYL